MISLSLEVCGALYLGLSVTNLWVGGPAGSVVASRLARQIPNIEVLLLEGGGTNSDLVHRSPEVRYALPFTQPELNWLYKSTPQAQLNERIIACHRGRGLGGSSAINFSGWLLGDKEDFNEWAERVDDLVWKWDGNNGVKERFRKIEKLDYEGNEARDKFLDKEALSLHSREGMVGLSQGQHWPEHATILFKAAKEFGVSLFILFETST
jgi:choline dehydrogenase-like flavoprotein